MKLTKNGNLRINFRHSMPEERVRLRCNFECSYCNQYATRQIAFGDEQLAQAKKIWELLSQLEDELRVRVNFDGETLIDKYAKEICFLIADCSNVKVLEIISNNSVNPRSYLEKFDPKKTSFNFSYHPECISLDRFINNIEVLRKEKFNLFATLLVAPQWVRDLPNIAAIFKRKGICFQPLLLTGYYLAPSPLWIRWIHERLNWYILRNKPYPWAYKKENLELIRKSAYSELDFEYQYGKSVKDEDCYAGVDMINVFLDGRVRRCFYHDLGSVEDLMEGRVRLKDEAYPCPKNRCQCPAHYIGLKNFREQYSLDDRFVDHYLNF